MHPFVMFTIKFITVRFKMVRSITRHSRDCQGFQNPQGSGVRVHEGKGRGWDFVPSWNPYPWPGVKGMYEGTKSLARGQGYV